MRNVLLTLSYDGSAYHGWQVQPNATTVQQVLGEAFFSLTGETPKITGCSRTDAGVHANMFCCNIQTETALTCDKLLTALNALLPFSVAVTDCREAEPDFHARYDCVSKMYKYVVWNSKVRNPFLTEYAHHYKYPLDERMLDKQAKDFIGEHDFTAFCAAGASTVSNVREIYSADVTREGDKVVFSFCGNGFLYNMVRIMVGTLLDISSGKIPQGSIPDIISSKQRNNAGITASSKGLYLHKVNYDKNNPLIED